MDYSDGMNLITQVSAANNAWSAEQAQKQMAFEERMSNTAHQREVADLKAAGLNPVLSAHGAGATTPTGAMGGTDTNLTSALYGLVKDAINSQMVSAQAVASVAKSASGNGKSSQKGDANAVKNAILGAFNNSTSGVKQAVEKAKFEQDREAKRLDTKYQSTENAKVFGIPFGVVLNEVAEKKGYDTWPEMIVGEVENYVDAVSANKASNKPNPAVGQALASGVNKYTNSGKSLSKSSGSDKGSTNNKKSFGHSSGNFKPSSVKTIKRVTK